MTKRKEPEPARSSNGRSRSVGEATYRALSYYFSIHWDWAGVSRYVDHVLGRFAVPPDPAEQRNPPTPGMPPRYDLVDLGPSEPSRYRVLFGGAPLLKNDDPTEVLFHLFWHINSETTRRTGDFLLVHAGAVSTPAGEGMLLPASSGSGKTTLVAGLIRAGWGYLSDEAGALDPVGRRLYPYPKALTMKSSLGKLFPSVRPRFTSLSGLQTHVRPEDIRPGSVTGPCEVRYIVAPRYEAGAGTTLEPMSRAWGAMELGRNALNLATYGRRALDLVADVAGGARVFRLVSGDLQDAVAALTELTRGNSNGRSVRPA